MDSSTAFPFNITDSIKNNEVINRRHLSDIASWRALFLFLFTYGAFKDYHAYLTAIYQAFIHLKSIKSTKSSIFTSINYTSRSNIFNSETVLETVFSYLDFKSLCKVSTLNKLCYSLSTSESVWENLIDKDFNVRPRLSYKYSHIGTGRTKDAYCYSMRLFRYSVYGAGKKNGNTLR